MSDTEAEPFQLNLLLEPVRANLQAPEVTTSTSRGRSRKRNADEVSGEVPSVSRRRRLTTADTAAFMQTSYPPACCIDGIVQPGPCLLQPAQAYQPANTIGALSPLPPVYRQQVIAPQIHAQMAVMPSTSVNSVATPVSLHVHSQPSINLTYPTPVQLSQSRDQLYYLSSEQPQANSVRMASQQSQRVPQVAMNQNPQLRSVIYPSNISDLERANQALSTEPNSLLQDFVYLRQAREWESAMFSSGTQRRWAATMRDPTSRVEMLISRVRQAAAQAAAAAAAQAVDTTAILIAAQQVHERALSQTRFIESLDLNSNHPMEMVSGVATPQLPREWVNRGTNFQESVPPQQQPSTEVTENVNMESSFRNWEAAVLQIFDRVAPQMNFIRMQPKGMPKNEIDQLQSFRLTNPKLLKEKVCVICQCDFEKRDHVRVLPCEHHYHLKCIDKWLKTNRTCPICRKSASDNATDAATAAAAAAAAAAVATTTMSTSSSASTATVASVTSSPHIAVQVFTQLSGSHHHQTPNSNII
uniref:RING-type domain-containing protein n=1 Tax=Syphacia muris TaxID=451379 RepID=A0A0N5AC16_9BILA